MNYKVLNTSINQVDGSLKITVELPDKFSIDDMMNSVDEKVKKYGDYRGTGFTLSRNRKYERAYVFETTLPYHIFIDTQIN